MANGQMQDILTHLRKILAARQDSGAPDWELLRRFAVAHDEAAFEVLVWRHHRLVLSVCSRVLADANDVEDAFQATFLVLARKAGLLQRTGSLSSWLFGVARRVALEARAGSARQLPRGPAPVPPSCPEPCADMIRQELQSIFVEELGQLPEKYRAPVVLCYLEGMTYEMAGQQLGCSKGTISTRLTRARHLLRRRLAGRGLALSASSLATWLCDNAAAADPPTSLVAATIKAAALAAGKAAVAGAVPPRVSALTEGVLKAMLPTKLNIGVVIALVSGLMGLGIGALTYAALAQKEIPAAQPTAEARDNAPRDTKDLPKQPKKEPQPAPDQAEPDWHRLAQGELVAVDVERCLYEVKGEKRFLMAVRLTNLTKVEIGVDWQEARPAIYPNQWGVHDATPRQIIDERRVLHSPPDKDKVLADFKAGRLTPLPAGKAIVLWTAFERSGRADVDKAQGKYLIVSMDGQFSATDGKTVDTISCAWDKSLRHDQTDVVMPVPVRWKIKEPTPKADSSGQAGKGGSLAATDALVRTLDEMIDTKDLLRSFWPLLDYLTDQMGQRGKELPFFVDVDAFSKEVREVLDGRLPPPNFKLQPLPARMSVRALLQMALNEFDGGAGTYLIRQQRVEITSKKAAALPNLLKQTFAASFDGTPLDAALDELSEITGVSVVIDGRARDKMGTPITARFRNDVPLLEALRLVTESAGLKLVELPAGPGPTRALFVTTPEHALVLQR
jgi:RNA polymerase sigma factor (sigma-70 family)